MSSLVTWENTLWAWGFIIMVREMFTFSYIFQRWLLSFIKLPGSEEKCYQFWVNCYTQISLRRMWISNSARLLYILVNICFRVNTPSSKSNYFSVFILYPWPVSAVLIFFDDLNKISAVIPLLLLWIAGDFTGLIVCWRLVIPHTYLYNSLPQKTWRAS